MFSCKYGLFFLWKRKTFQKVKAKRPKGRANSNGLEYHSQVAEMNPGSHPLPRQGISGDMCPAGFQNYYELVISPLTKEVSAAVTLSLPHHCMLDVQMAVNLGFLGHNILDF